MFVYKGGKFINIKSPHFVYGLGAVKTSMPNHERVCHERFNPLESWNSIRNERNKLREKNEKLERGLLKLAVERDQLKVENIGLKFFTLYGSTGRNGPECNSQTDAMCPSKILGVNVLVKGTNWTICKVNDRNGHKFVLKKVEGESQETRMREELTTLSICQNRGIPGIAPGFWYVGQYGMGLLRPLFSTNLSYEIENNFSFTRFVSMMEQLLQTVDALHENMLMHGNITFQNVLIYKEAAFLVDFGDGCALDDEGTSHKGKKFEPCQNHFLPPAVALKGFPTGEGTDFWSIIMIVLGVIFGRDIPPLNYTDSRAKYVELFDKRQFSPKRTFPRKLDEALRRLVVFVDMELNKPRSSLSNNPCFRDTLEDFLAACLPDRM